MCGGGWDTVGQCRCGYVRERVEVNRGRMAVTKNVIGVIRSSL